MLLTHPIKLGVNIDHVATLRQVRGVAYPDPLFAALWPSRPARTASRCTCARTGGTSRTTTCTACARALQTRMNLEMAATDAMLAIAREVRPHDCCLVPEKRAELTTEGGLDVAGQVPRLRDYCAALREAGSRVSLFIDPEQAQLERCAGRGRSGRGTAHRRVCRSDRRAPGDGADAARHGGPASARRSASPCTRGTACTTTTCSRSRRSPEIVELNIGHAIIARAVFDGLAAAVRDMQ